MSRKTIQSKGEFKKTIQFLRRVMHSQYMSILNHYGELGVKALSSNTPKKTGKTSESWSYEIIETPTGATIRWNNSNVVKYVNIALILQYGHATRNGAWVEGVDYINPALKPIFEKMSKTLWEEVTSS